MEQLVAKRKSHLGLQRRNGERASTNPSGVDELELCLAETPDDVDFVGVL